MKKVLLLVFLLANICHAGYFPCPLCKGTGIAQPTELENDPVEGILGKALRELEDKTTELEEAIRIMKKLDEPNPYLEDYLVEIDSITGNISFIPISSSTANSVELYFQLYTSTIPDLGVWEAK